MSRKNQPEETNPEAKLVMLGDQPEHVVDAPGPNAVAEDEDLATSALAVLDQLDAYCDRKHGELDRVVEIKREAGDLAMDPAVAKVRSLLNFVKNRVEAERGVL